MKNVINLETQRLRGNTIQESLFLVYYLLFMLLLHLSQGLAARAPKRFTNQFKN